MRTMTSDYFNKLDSQQQTELILTATFLADRLTHDHYIKLYSLDNFYIEVFFDDSTHLITNFRAFEHTMFVLPYLEKLKIAV